MDIKFRIEKRKIKNINIYIRPPYEELLVTAPLNAPAAVINRFIREKEPRIKKLIEKYRESGAKNAVSALTPELKKEYTERLYDIIPELIFSWQKKLGVEVSDWRLRQMKTCWGVCHCGKKTVTFNTFLGGKSERCIEYIVVHELCHLLEPSHNKRFHGFMDKFLPDWKQRKKELNGSL